jgi:histidinol-phosphate aminotransferase
MSEITNLIRQDLQSFISYAGSSMSNLKRQGKICFDSNEWFEGQWNRYPDSTQLELRNVFSGFYRVLPEQVVATNGSDEAIDLLFRLFCRAGKESVLVPKPSYAMYKTIADFNGIMTEFFTIDLERGYSTETILEAVKPETRIVVFCTPNNPTSHVMHAQQLSEIVSSFPGLVIVDEAYTEFSTGGSLLDKCGIHDRVVYLRTLSKMYGLAGLRIGVAIGCKELIDWIISVKPPYNVNLAAINEAIQIVSKPEIIQERMNYTRIWISRISEVLLQLSFVKKVYSSETNFLLIEVADSKALSQYLADKDILVRLRPDIPGGIRFSIGNPQENNYFIDCIKTFKN